MIFGFPVGSFYIPGAHLFAKYFPGVWIPSPREAMICCWLLLHHLEALKTLIPDKVFSSGKSQFVNIFVILPDHIMLLLQVHHT